MLARSVEFLREVENSDCPRDSPAVRAACGWAADEIERLQAIIAAADEEHDLQRQNCMGIDDADLI